MRIVSGSQASYAFLIGADGQVAAHRIPLGSTALAEKVKELRASLGFAQPSGSAKTPGSSWQRVRRAGPAAAITSLDPALSPVPE